MVVLERINVCEAVGRENDSKLNFFSMYFVRNNEEIYLSFKNSEKYWTQALRMKSSIMPTIWGGGQFVGSRCLYSSMKCITAAMPSSCGIFVYREVTSAVTKMALGGRGGSFSLRLRKCFVSLTCDGRLLARGWMKWVTWAERWSVGPSYPETIGRGGQPGL